MFIVLIGSLLYCTMCSHRAAGEFCKMSGLLCSYGLYQVVSNEQMALYCRGNTANFSARVVCVDEPTGKSKSIKWSGKGLTGTYVVGGNCGIEESSLHSIQGRQCLYMHT